MWLRIGGPATNYVTFVPPITTHSSSSPPSAPNHYFDDNEQGDIEEEAIGYSGYSKLDQGSGFNFNQPPLQQHREIRKMKNILPNSNANTVLQGLPQHFKSNCQEEKFTEINSLEAIEMLPYEWDRVHKFAKKVNWKIIFALNVQMRGVLDWDMSNALDLIQYSLSQGYRTAWELGNGKRFDLYP